MRRRTLLATGLASGMATLARPALVRAATATTLKFIPYADLALLDPAVSAFVTRNHVLMVFDTLYGVDEAGAVQPQMVEGHTTSEDGLTWSLTLRPGMTFHDGSAVLARDCVASIRRWCRTRTCLRAGSPAAVDRRYLPHPTTTRSDSG